MMRCCSQLMGDLSLPPVWSGDHFRLGFEEPTLSAATRDPGVVAQYLEDAGLSYDTRSWEVTGWIRPWVQVEGRVNQYWDSGTDFREAIIQVVAANYGLRAGTEKFEVETHPEGFVAPIVATTGPPTQDGSGVFDSIGAKFGLSSDVLIIGLLTVVGVALVLRK